MIRLPGLGIVKGMSLTLRKFFEPKATIKYPEVRLDVPHKFRGRLQLLYDEYGTLKCETCFQCAQACPIECIDMGGMDTKGRYHIHWGAPETYGERRDESALRRSGRPVPDQAYEHFDPIEPGPVDEILARHDHDPKRMLEILEETQAAYGHLPVGALKLISQKTGAWYAMIYGTASYYRHLRFEPPMAEPLAAATADARQAGRRRPEQRLRRAAASVAIQSPAKGRHGPDRWPQSSGLRRAGRRSSSHGIDRATPSISPPPRRPAHSSACGERSTTSVRPGRSPRSPRRGCAAEAAPASRRPKNGGQRPRSTPHAASSSATATVPIPRP